MAKKSASSIISEYENLNKLLDKQLSSSKSLNDIQAQRNIISEKILNNQKTLADLQKKYAEGDKVSITDITKIRNQQSELVKDQDKLNKSIEKSNKSRQKTIDLAKELGNQLKLGWTYLQQQDKIIRTTILNLGVTGTKADLIRGSFEKSVAFAARLNATTDDIRSIMEGYADETGRARALTSDMVDDILMVGKGTGLGVEEATKLGSQFELMGFDARQTLDYTQGIINTSERMGVNTTKVLKNLINNFKVANTYSFRNGSKAIAEMAMNSEKFKVDMKSALDAADAGKSLEKAIDLAANLQVMGGEFAKTDPLQWMYLARNEPDKLTAKISEMTRGIVTFRKTSEGTFEKFISPSDRQRLESVAKSLNISNEEMVQIAQRRAELDKMTQSLAGTGLSPREKELIQGAAVFNARSGRFEVNLAGRMRDISTLTSEQAKSFASEQVSLQERAKQAMTFDETFKSTIQILKATLLPLLRVVNGILTPVKWVADQLVKLSNMGWGGIVAAGGILLAGATAWKLTINGLGSLLTKWGTSKGGIFGKVLGGATTGEGAIGGTAPTSPFFTKTGMVRKGAPELLRAQGMKSLGAGVGVGGAALGIGAGIGIAAVGISKLADSMTKLDNTKLWALPATVLAIGAAFAMLSPAIIAVGTASEVSSVGLLALGVAVLGIGAGIGVAAMGIGKMAEGLGSLVASSKGAGTDLLKVAAGIGAMGLALSTFSLGFVGFGLFASTLYAISKTEPAMTRVGAAFDKMNTAVAQLKGSKEDFVEIQKAIESISKANIKGGGVLGELANLLKSPIKMELANNKIGIVDNITLNIDGTKFMQKIYNSQIALQRHVDAKNGLSR